MSEKMGMYELRVYPVKVDGRWIEAEYTITQTINDGDYQFDFYGFKSVETGYAYGIGEIEEVNTSPSPPKLEDHQTI